MKIYFKSKLYNSDSVQFRKSKPFNGLIPEPEETCKVLLLLLKKLISMYIAVFSNLYGDKAHHFTREKSQGIPSNKNVTGLNAEITLILSQFACKMTFVNSATVSLKTKGLTGIPDFIC